MSRRSLFVRLATAATVLIVLATTLAAVGLRTIFDREIERRAAGELTQIVKTIAAQASVDAGGKPVLEVVLHDQRFDEPYGGLYWQVSRTDGRNARSRSLWDHELKVVGDAVEGERRVVDLVGPNGTALLAVVQRILVPSPEGRDVALRLVAAVDREDMAAAQRSFLHLLALSLTVLGVILIVVMAFFIRLAVGPFATLARELQAIHGGTSRVLSGDFPDEVQSVVDDLNRLIAFQDAALDRARTHAGDLAHGLKTPLAVLDAVGRQAADSGRGDLAQPIEEQVGQMRRQVDRVLARARAGVVAALGRKMVLVAPIAEKVVRAFERLPNSDALVWELEASPKAVFPGEEGDLTEMLGNLLDNARKWAEGRVRLRVTAGSGGLVLQIDDDGPGLPMEHLQIVRGRRWDEEQPGTGFGLAITRDLAEGYRGSLELGRSDLGGLSATITIPVVVPRS